MKQSPAKACAHYATLTASQTAQHFDTDISTGLSSKHAHEKQRQCGSNAITKKETTWLQRFLRQFLSPFVGLFIAVALVLFFLHEIVNGSIILFFVIASVCIGFYQEYRVAKTLQMLNKYLVMLVWVRRDTVEKQIPSTDLVPGDILVLYPGECVAADIRLVAVENFFVDESPLTGESAPVQKMLSDHDHDIAQVPANIVCAGTTVTSGKAIGIAFAIGDNTRMGSIAQLSSQETVQRSALVEGTIDLGTFIIKFVSITMVIIFVVTMLFKQQGPTVLEFLIFAVTLALSVIPEALPIVVSFCLSRGVARLAKLHVVVKRLSAVEDLGGMQILCTDKTGTLTENKMAVAALYPANQVDLLRYAALASTRQKETVRTMAHGFDCALLEALSAIDNEWCAQRVQKAEIPFDPVRLRNLMLVGDDQTNELIVRGAPEVIVDLCTTESVQQLPEYAGWITAQGGKGNRILALAKKTLSARPDDLLSAEHKGAFTFLGLISFADPIKKTAHAAIAKARHLGITIKILSGDSKEVCAAVGREAGLIDQIDEVVTGHEFAQKSAQEQQELVMNRSVFARMLPEQKYEIVQMLRISHTVGYLGDGINDAPALRAADVSLAVNGAANVAREVADILLLRSSLMCVIDGIEEGRKIVINTIKYVRTTLAANFGNFYAIAIASLFANYLPMQPAHILLVNLLTDFPMIAIATDSVSRVELAMPRRFNVKGMILLALILGLVSTTFDLIFFALFHQISAGVVQTGWFVESIFTELVFIFSVRTVQPFFKRPFPSKPLALLSVVVAIVALVLPRTSIGRTIFGFTLLTYGQLLLMGLLVLAYFVATEIVKLCYYRWLYRCQ